MQINEEGLKLIKQFEGCALKAYKCPANVWTIGYGHTGMVDGKPICQGMVITQAKAEQLLKEDMDSNNKYVKAVENLKVPMNENQYSALISFAYNLGAGIFTGSLLKAIKKQDWEDVARQMKLYNKARVNGKLTVLKGLDRRRKAEAELLLTPVKEVFTPQEDKELSQAVSKIIKSGIDINFNQWKRTDLIKTAFVPILLDKLGGLDKLVEKKIISDKTLWEKKQYKATHIRSLLIKYSKTL